jgi:hypothetical protein
MNSQSISLNQPRSIEVTRHPARHGGRRGVGSFLGHFGEMFAAMMIGMPLFGMPLRALQGALLGPSSIAIPELRALGMAISMTVAMIAWMLYRGHSRTSAVEMGAAMILPTVALFPLHWMVVISGGMLIALAHGLMLPSMLAVMVLRRTQYGM